MLVALMAQSRVGTAVIFRYAPRKIPALLLRAFPYPKSRAGAGTLHSLNSFIFRYIEM